MHRPIPPAEEVDSLVFARRRAAMKPFAMIVLVLALSGCASQAVTPVSGGARPLAESRDRPVILFVTTPGMDFPHQIIGEQVIGDERPHLVLDGIS